MRASQGRMGDPAEMEEALRYSVEEEVDRVIEESEERVLSKVDRKVEEDVETFIAASDVRMRTLWTSMGGGGEGSRLGFAALALGLHRLVRQMSVEESEAAAMRALLALSDPKPTGHRTLAYPAFARLIFHLSAASGREFGAMADELIEGMRREEDEVGRKLQRELEQSGMEDVFDTATDARAETLFKLWSSPEGRIGWTELVLALRKFQRAFALCDPGMSEARRHAKAHEPGPRLASETECEFERAAERLFHTMGSAASITHTLFSVVAVASDEEAEPGIAGVASGQHGMGTDSEEDPEEGTILGEGWARRHPHEAREAKELEAVEKAAAELIVQFDKSGEGGMDRAGFHRFISAFARSSGHPFYEVADFLISVSSLAQNSKVEEDYLHAVASTVAREIRDAQQQQQQQQHAHGQRQQEQEQQQEMEQRQEMEQS